ncbi:MAG TPA: hypothetical protein DEA96_01080, partial [Leptospiraceae bacterium]|nr:hypothetical protein [Leptospiraceae bacterium]
DLSYALLVPEAPGQIGAVIYKGIVMGVLQPLTWPNSGCIGDLDVRAYGVPGFPNLIFTALAV